VKNERSLHSKKNGNRKKWILELSGIRFLLKQLGGVENEGGKKQRGSGGGAELGKCTQGSLGR